jgi:NDP-sugar pyrophosphorylase family protein
MIILIPLGGSGQRFKENGYILPKALINVYSKPILYWLLDNLNISKDVKYVVIPYNKEYKPYRLEDRLKNDYPNINFKFKCLEKDTRGAAETALIAMNLLDDVTDCPIISLDSDNFYTYDIIRNWEQKNKIFTFIDKDTKPIYSYVETKNEKDVVSIVEKQKNI